MQRVKALRQEAERRRQRTEVRQSFVAWAVAAGYRPAAHHELLIAHLEELESDPDTDTLLVFMPPGSAKSTYVNNLFPAWYVARNPERNVLTASHSSELAERWGRKTRNLIASHGGDLGVTLSEDSAAAYRWATTEGGEYLAVGVGVGIAGFRADLGIIDDPFGSREDAESRRIRDRVWDWYSDDFSTRLKRDRSGSSCTPAGTTTTLPAASSASSTRSAAPTASCPCRRRPGLGTSSDAAQANSFGTMTDTATARSFASGRRSATPARGRASTSRTRTRWRRVLRAAMVEARRRSPAARDPERLRRERLRRDPRRGATIPCTSWSASTRTATCTSSTSGGNRPTAASGSRLGATS